MTGSPAGNGPGDGSAPAAAGPQQQQLIISAQYIKDLSFENPRAPHSLTQQTEPPTVEINVDVKATAIGPDSYEAVLHIHVGASTQGEPLFLLELAYGAVATVRNVPPEMLSAVILVETPRLMFPFARNIIAAATRDGGFPPLMINPIDFAELLRRQQAAAAAAEPASPPA